MHILHFPIFFLTRMGLASQSEWNTSLMNPAARSFSDLFAYGPAPLVIEATSGRTARNNTLTEALAFH